MEEEVEEEMVVGGDKWKSWKYVKEVVGGGAGGRWRRRRWK